jgi:isochorismate hydrolase
MLKPLPQNLKLLENWAKKNRLLGEEMIFPPKEAFAREPAIKFRVPANYALPGQEDNLTVVVVDMQDSFLISHDFSKRKTLIDNQKKILKYCSYFDIPVAALSFKGHGGINQELSNLIDKIPRSDYFEKGDDNGFSSKRFCNALDEWSSDILLTTGINTPRCIWETIAYANRKGYRVATAEDILSAATYLDDSSALGYLSKNTYYSKTYLDLLPLFSLKSPLGSNKV